MVSKLFVDGSNLFRGMDDVLPTGSFIDFSDLLAEIRKDFRIDSIEFYATYMGLNRATTRKEKLCVRAQNEFLNRARTIPELTFYRGYYSTKGKEKGVDVHLAVDMALQAVRHEVDQAVLMTGDDDLLYPVQILRKLRVPMHLAAFCTRFPFGIFYNTNRCVVYDYDNHFQTTILPTIQRPLRNLRVQSLPENLPVQVVTIN